MPLLGYAHKREYNGVYLAAGWRRRLLWVFISQGDCSHRDLCVPLFSYQWHKYSQKNGYLLRSVQRVRCWLVQKKPVYSPSCNFRSTGHQISPILMSFYLFRVYQAHNMLLKRHFLFSSVQWRKYSLKNWFSSFGTLWETPENIMKSVRETIKK